jgi:hypothetical protein
VIAGVLWFVAGGMVAAGPWVWFHKKNSLLGEQEYTAATIIVTFTIISAVAYTLVSHWWSIPTVFAMLALIGWGQEKVAQVRVARRERGA